MGRFCRTYDPVSLVIVIRAIPVPVCVAVISTPGRTAPLWSFAVPLIWAVAWAHTWLQFKIKTTVRTKVVKAIRFIFDFLRSNPSFWHPADSFELLREWYLMWIKNQKCILI